MLKKIIFTLICFIFMIFCLNHVIYSADNFNFGAWDSVSGKADTPTKKVIGTAINVIQVVATGTSIIMLTYISIKYMMASAQDKAEMKKSMSIFVFGAILIFGSAQILKIIVDFTTDVFK